MNSAAGRWTIVIQVLQGVSLTPYQSTGLAMQGLRRKPAGRLAQASRRGAPSGLSARRRAS